MSRARTADLDRRRAGAAVLAPLGLPPFAMTLLTEAVILGLFAMSLDLMFGYTRLVSFGHAAAYGFGAYACGWLLLHTGMPLLFAVFAAGFADRHHRHRRRLDVHAGDRRLLLDADAGLRPAALRHLLQMDLGDGRLGRAGGHPAHDRPVRLRGLCRARPASTTWRSPAWSAASCCARALVRSPFGAVLRGIRENEAKTTALGYNTRLYKIAVVAISYALGGLAGALYAPFAGFANTELLFWLLSGQVLIMVIVGGAGTLIGPVLGAAFFMLMEHQLSAWTEAWALYFGLIFIAFVLFAPEGIWGLATHARLRRTAPGPDRGAARARRRDAALRRPGRARPGRHARRGRRGARRHRSQRRRQDDAVQRDHRHGEAERGQRSASPASRSPACRATRSAGCGISRTFQITALFPEMSARENAQAGGAGPPSRGAGSRSAAPGSSSEAQDRAPMRRSSSSAWPASPTGPPACSRTATSACSRSPWRWRSSRACCCSTSRRRASRSRRRRRRWRRLRASCRPRG